MQLPLSGLLCWHSTAQLTMKVPHSRLWQQQQQSPAVLVGLAADHACVRYPVRTLAAEAEDCAAEAEEGEKAAAAVGEA